MRIGCFDKSASSRLELQRYVDGAFQAARDIIGHLRGLEIVPVTLAEISLPTPFDAVVIGPAFTAEERVEVCRKLSEAALPLFLILAESEYNFRALRRFERFTPEMFSQGESPLRLVHRLCLLHEKRRATGQGRLVALRGMKGGVGSTTVATAIAHAASSFDRSAILLDLAPGSPLTHYLFTPRLSSADYASALMNRIAPDRTLAEKCITESPNGIRLFLQPAGGDETRLQWLHDRERVEITLFFLEVLSTMYDLIVADLGTVEGALTAALLAQADLQLLISSNEPASMHLLSRRLIDSPETDDRSRRLIVMSGVFRYGLSVRDGTQLLRSLPGALEERLFPLDHDERGILWMGTGNSFYTEAREKAQDQIDEIVTAAIGEPTPARLPQSARRSFSSLFFAPMIHSARRSRRETLVKPGRLLPPHPTPTPPAPGTKQASLEWFSPPIEVAAPGRESLDYSNLR